nr:MAG TPA: hypothetical protein [Caudoviricetes sp.]
MSDFFYKKNQNFLFFSIIIKEWLKYTTKILIIFTAMLKNQKKQSKRDGIHFSC